MGVCPLPGAAYRCAAIDTGPVRSPLAGRDRAAGRRAQLSDDNGVIGRTIQLEVLFRIDPVEMPESDAESSCARWIEIDDQ